MLGLLASIAEGIRELRGNQFDSQPGNEDPTSLAARAGVGAGIYIDFPRVLEAGSPQFYGARTKLLARFVPSVDSMGESIPCLLDLEKLQQSLAVGTSLRLFFLCPLSFSLTLNHVPPPLKRTFDYTIHPGKYR